MPYTKPFVTEIEIPQATPAKPQQDDKKHTNPPKKSTKSKKPSNFKGHFVAVIGLVGLYAASATITARTLPNFMPPPINSFEDCIRAEKYMVLDEDPHTCYTGGEVYKRVVLGASDQPTPEPSPTSIPTPTPTPSTNIRLFELEDEVSQIDYLNRNTSSTREISPVLNNSGDILFLDEGILYHYSLNDFETESIFEPEENQQIIRLPQPYNEEVFPTLLNKDESSETIIEIHPQRREVTTIFEANQDEYRDLTHLAKTDNFHLVKATVCDEDQTEEEGGEEACTDYIYKVVNQSPQPLTQIDSDTTQYLGYTPVLRALVMAIKDPDTTQFQSIQTFQVDTFATQTIYDLETEDKDWLPGWIGPDKNQLALRTHNAIAILDLSLRTIVDRQNINECPENSPTSFSSWTSQGIMIKCATEDLIRRYSLNPLEYETYELPEDFSGNPKALGEYEQNLIFYAYPN